ncbi:MAG: hypothetical protein L0Y56_00660 [Nitrospira sp.]|nr:hypothetical protein [Nitrospira sp.]
MKWCHLKDDDISDYEGIMEFDIRVRDAFIFGLEAALLGWEKHQLPTWCDEEIVKAHLAGFDAAQSISKYEMAEQYARNTNV